MEDKMFILIKRMLDNLRETHDLVHTNGTYTHIVNKYNYQVSVIDLDKVTRTELTEQESMRYLTACGDSRQDKYNFIYNMEAFICQQASMTDSYTRKMNTTDITNAEWACDGNVYHWNGGQLYTNYQGRVVAYDFTTSQVTYLTLARSFRYARENRLHSVDVDSVRYASRMVHTW